MKFYLVGGAVRDKLLNLPIKERDWVVVNATPHEMLAKGFRQVGKDFPVFLHPETHEEYALARKERKISTGYTGFSFDTSQMVTLEEDLVRRDLTINAMAEETSGVLIDPYHGKDDLEKKILRHVSPAFSEDPVRLLRVCRFLARYYHLGFEIADETIQLMRLMVENGEVDALVPERVWKETERALGEKNPEQFFKAMAQCGALQRLFPEIKTNGAGLSALILSADRQQPVIERFACLFHDIVPKLLITQFSKRYRVPNAFRDLAVVTATHFETLLHLNKLNAHELLNLFYVLDVFRKEKRLTHLINTCMTLSILKQHSFDALWLQTCIQKVKSFPVVTLLESGLKGEALARELKKKRTEVIQSYLDGDHN